MRVGTHSPDDCDLYGALQSTRPLAVPCAHSAGYVMLPLPRLLCSGSASVCGRPDPLLAALLVARQAELPRGAYCWGLSLRSVVRRTPAVASLRCAPVLTPAAPAYPHPSGTRRPLRGLGALRAPLAQSLEATACLPAYSSPRGVATVERCSLSRVSASSLR